MIFLANAPAPLIVFYERHPKPSLKQIFKDFSNLSGEQSSNKVFLIESLDKWPQNIILTKFWLLCYIETLWQKV